MQLKNGHSMSQVHSRSYDTAVFVPEKKHNKPINWLPMGIQIWGTNAQWIK